jgi:formate dehydrogenase major subunit
MGATQKTVGTANVRAYSILLLATGSVGSSGTGANIFRGHTNVQGATDLGLDIATLPGYYGLDEAAWRHFSRVWDVPVRVSALPLRRQEADGGAGHHLAPAGSTRGAAADQVEQPTTAAMIVFGHGGNTVTACRRW